MKRLQDSYVTCVGKFGAAFGAELLALPAAMHSKWAKVLALGRPSAAKMADAGEYKITRRGFPATYKRSAIALSLAAGSGRHQKPVTTVGRLAWPNGDKHRFG